MRHHLILKARACGWTHLTQHWLRIGYRGDTGLWIFMCNLGLVELPWWMKPSGAPIRDPRRLLA